MDILVCNQHILKTKLIFYEDVNKKFKIHFKFDRYKQMFVVIVKFLNIALYGKYQ